MFPTTLLPIIFFGVGSQRTASYIEVSYDYFLPLGGKEGVELLLHRVSRETVAYRK